MEPFRAFVADLLPERQRTRGFAMQSLFIGLGAVIASALPWLLSNVFHLQPTGGTHAIPISVRISFYVGAAAFLGAVLWTILSTKEYPPDDLADFLRSKSERNGFTQNASEIVRAIGAMPSTMRQLAPVQLLTWLGLFCMWLYFPVAVARNVFGAPDQTSPIYAAGIEWGGICFAVYSVVCFGFSFLLPSAARFLGRKNTHSLCLLSGALALMSVMVIHDKFILLLVMVGVGIAWASILSVPYAILAGSLPPEKTGTYMGIFNFFIVIPEILASLFFGWLMNHLLHNNRMAAVIAGGVFLLIASGLMQRVEDHEQAPVAQIPGELSAPAMQAK
jgi:maltose/moltooligosaccharide transporter